MTNVIRGGVFAGLLLLAASGEARAQFVDGPGGSLGYWNGRNYTYVYPRYFSSYWTPLVVPNGSMWLQPDGRVHGSWTDPGSGAGQLTDFDPRNGRRGPRIDPRRRQPGSMDGPRTFPRVDPRRPFLPRPLNGPNPFLQSPRW